MGIALCSLAFLITFRASQRGLGSGMVVLLTIGYFYGAVRAWIFDGFSHFVFDASILGLYTSYFLRPGAWSADPHQVVLQRWVFGLIGWPIILVGLYFCYPLSPLIQFVGLRATVWFVPVLLLGASVRPGDLIPMTRALAVLNLLALGVAIGEYQFGLEAFLPRNPATDLIFRSKDIAGFAYHRIPSTFIAAAAYGGVMVASLPLIVGRWVMPEVSTGEKALLMSAMVAAAAGVFLSGSRTAALMLFALGSWTLFHVRARLGLLTLVTGLGAMVAYIVMGNTRLQRFLTLEDTEQVAHRLQGSLHLGMMDLLIQYPLGAGLGSAFGTSIPSFLQNLAPTPIGVENEFARIAVEQSLIGALLWLGFVGWVLTRRLRPLAPRWILTTRLMGIYVALNWLTAFFGCGLLASIPGTILLLFQMGFLTHLRQPDPGSIVELGMAESKKPSLVSQE